MNDIVKNQIATVPSKGRKRHSSISALHDAAMGHEIQNANAGTLWYDSRSMQDESEENRANLINKIIEAGFNGVVFYPDNWTRAVNDFPAGFRKIVHFANSVEWEDANIHGIFSDSMGGNGSPVISSSDAELLARVREDGWQTCLRIHVDDANTLQQSFTCGAVHDYVMVSFRDPTNIPLELVIAELHDSSVWLLKEVGTDVDDAVIALGVLEVGSDGIVAGFTEPAQFDEFVAKLEAARNPPMTIQTGTVKSTQHLGLGYRACIDTTHLFEPDEGLLVGSTSTGGILCCPEVFHLPYMELRPFRVNAASVHSYVFHANDRTNYISELHAGAQLTAVNANGRTRQIFVGRIKTEIRPLLLIEVEFEEGKSVNIVMQDDWHVRVFSDKALPRHITELRPGDKILGYVTTPGRHVGVKVDEHIIEV
ncbi:3-dehydroquinate synthase II [Paraburkholderia diazotrophica]|uniref:3-dehydroquinate synthase II n=1 Tax=Paraburkholderia diazotrophica TaxID=667676 RepID=A0A1H6WRD4_9BURK|nr:3-dehydroquinate synthase II [Paraburkholderia diazotrophica]SEJ19559.1 3-dehydroquinate synthase II [Paraburkholderia diazotrophica]